MLGCSPVGELDLTTADALVRSLLPDAGRIALEHFRTGVASEDKGGHPAGFDPVTVADRGVEAHLRAGIEARFPDHRIVGEEFGTSGPADAIASWIIDPIDGTKAYVSGVPAWGTLVGLVVDGRAVAGWIHQPFLDETFAGVGGAGFYERGAYGHPTRTSTTTDLDTAVMYSTHPSMFEGPGEQAAFERLAGAVRLQRFGGDCYSYGLLAIGCIDLVVESSLQPYDIIAVIPVVEAAGGVITDRAGNPPLDGGFVVAAATPELHAATLALVNQEP